ncbi:MAG: AAA family ATPase [Chloroflexi bacterium]|nr:AAA family ATPase [Chloroflexota bacterium]
MRIGVAGKGGSGKTTIAATMARHLARSGLAVNALDGDPNPNLAVAIGVPAEEADRLQRVPSDELEERTDGDSSSMHFRRPFDEIVEEYGAVGPDGVRVLTMTGLLGAGKGCICGQHSAVRGVVAGLGEERPDDLTILDTEASLEHLSRGTVRHVEGLVVVVEPYFRALETMKRTVPLARELGIPSVWAMANKIRSADDEAVIRDYCERLDVDLLGMVPFDDAVVAADRNRTSLIDHSVDAPSTRAIAQAADRLTAERVAVGPQS